MRPIDRGPVPLVNGRPKEVREYRDRRADLIERIGNYCAFCNMTLTDSIQVEHVVAQDIDQHRVLDWDNMLLACGACNRNKSNKPCPPDALLSLAVAFGRFGLNCLPIYPLFAKPWYMRSPVPRQLVSIHNSTQCQEIRPGLATISDTH